MAFLKSELPKKIRLSGADYFHVVLDRHAKHHRSGGNVVRMAFFLDGYLSKGSLQEKLDGIGIIHWLCNIKLVNGSVFSLPYWSYTDAGRTIGIREHESPRDAEIPDTIYQRDIPLNADHFIEADLVHSPDKKTILVFSWNHILLDGRGSGMLTDFINDPDPKIPLSAFFPKQNPSPGWISYMKNMYKVKSFLENSTASKIVSVANDTLEGKGDFHFKVIRFNKEETKLIEQNARKSGTRFGVNSFLIAVCSIAVNKIIKARGGKGDLWIPVPYDGRKRGAFGPVISNNVSSVFYTIKEEKLNDTRATVEHIAAQLADQLKQEMPKRYNMLQDMMRHLPGNIYYKLINRPGEGALASFLYTATGEGIGDMKSFFNIPVNDMVIYSPQTFPPGLTFLFLRFDNTLKVNISYSDAVITESELRSIETDLRTIFLKQE